jgi:hypothetical protein
MEINKQNNPDNKETKEIKETEQNDSFLVKLYKELKKGVRENYKTLILISIVSVLIIYLNIPNKLYKNVMIGGDNGNGNGGSGGSGGSTRNAEGGNEKKKKSFMSKYSPLSGGINIMTWIAKNIILFYLFLIFLVLIPSVPIALYMTAFYFIMSSLLGRITDV